MSLEPNPVRIKVRLRLFPSDPQQRRQDRKQDKERAEAVAHGLFLHALKHLQGVGVRRLEFLGSDAIASFGANREHVAVQLVDSELGSLSDYSVERLWIFCAVKNVLPSCPILRRRAVGLSMAHRLSPWQTRPDFWSLSAASTSVAVREARLDDKCWSCSAKNNRWPLCGLQRRRNRPFIEACRRRCGGSRSSSRPAGRDRCFLTRPRRH